MKTLICCALSAVVTAGGVAGLGYARSDQAASPAICGTRVVGTGYVARKVYVCTLAKMPTVQQEGFELRLREIDLRCNAYAADTSENSPAMLACDRLSLPSTK